jgi:nucleotide-binding universal stress UspA family protein
MDIVAKPVLVAYDGSAGAKRALTAAAALAAHTRTSLRILFAVGPLPGEAEATPALREAVNALISDAVAAVTADHGDLAVDTVVEWAAPRKAILAASADAAVTVIGRRGHGPIKSLLLGSVSGAVAAHAHGPVHVIPDHEPHDSDTVVVGIDGSPSSLAAADLAVRLTPGRRVELLLAWQPMQTAHAALGPYGGMIVTDPEVEEADYRRLLDTAIAAVSRTHPDVAVTGRMVTDDPAMALRDASESAAMVVVATRGHGGFAGMLLGSVAQSVIQTSTCPVLVTRADD